MTKVNFSVVFMGNGPVAAKSLELLKEWANIEFVITKRRPQHHKDPAPVEEYCKSHNLPYFYANNKQELQNIVESSSPSSKVAVVVDYGVIINKETINFFNKGIINSHFSLLPAWRGADPITFSILSGQKTTGVSLMIIDEGLDTGALIATQSLALTDQDSELLTDQLINISSSMLQKYLPPYMNNELSAKPQDTINNIVTHSRMLNKNDGNIDTNKPATVILREIRAYKQWPKSRLNYKDNVLIITDAIVSKQNVEQGKLVNAQGKLILGCRNSCLEITSLKPAGKNEMTASAFINGYGHLIS